jgi:hypothetical protein
MKNQRARSLDSDGKPKISEKVFQGQVRKAAIVNGFLFYHTWNSMRSAAGFPDCVLVHPKKGRLIFAELKSETGKVTPEQQSWIDALMDVPGVEGYILRPSDFDWFWESLRK